MNATSATTHGPIDDEAPTSDAATALMPPSGGPATRKPRPPLLMLLMWMVAGGIVGGVLAPLFRGGRMDIVAAVCFGLLPILWLHLLIHEGGHVLAGLARGMRAFALGIGPLRLERTQSGWRGRRARGIAGIGGFAVMTDPPGRTPRTADHAVYLLGGATANLATAAVVLPFALAAEVSIGSALAWCFVGAGIFYGVVNLLPFRSAGWRSDGLNLLALRRHPAEATIYRQMQTIVGCSLAGIRPRDWPADALPSSEATDDGILRRSAMLLRLSWALDAGHRDDADAMARHLAADYAGAPDGVRQNVAVMLASYAALQARSEPLLAAWLPLTDGSMFAMDAQKHWLRAELAALRDDVAGVSTEIGLARAALPHVHDAASQRQIEEYLAALESGREAGAGNRAS